MHELEAVAGPEQHEHLAHDQVVATYSSPGTQSVSDLVHMCTVESAEWARLSPITKRWPSGTGPAVQLQPIIGPLQSAPVCLT